MTDYKKFLGAGSEAVAPYFGGTRVDLLDRKVRLVGELAPGWWRFKIAGRNATPIEPAAPPDLAKLPAVRGHWCAGYVFASGTEARRLALPPIDEPAALQRCTARRWPSGDLVLDSLDFDDEAEAAARQALEDRKPLGDVRGATPSLRAAFGYATCLAVGRRLAIPVAPREVAAHAIAIADRGEPAAEPVLQALAELRRRHTLRDVAARSTVLRAVRDPLVRAEAALEAAGCRLLTCRSLAGDQLDIRFELDGERFSTIVAAGTLQVLDAGICLDGADSELTLDSLPSVIREAIETDRLNITRYG